ncbi:MAG: sigma 54-interacting transcriptional regulator [Deltaproteobacteria bacterium]|nr:sigma 54-interacting transcriptional regulator [Deltaproteobacteria bacterium]
MRTDTNEALGRSEPFLAFQQQLSRVAKINRPVLLQGERGTGKELAARRIHFLSQRWNEPLVTMNCAAITQSLLTSELFGAEAGAYTGADRRRTGRFEAAHRGTLFLDELGHLPMEAQEKVLRAVEYGSFERVGSTQPVEVDVRLVGATNADLRAMAEAGQFKRDLLDRLSFEVLLLPPLRERREDIMLLAQHFASRMARELGMEGLCRFSDRAEQSLLDYPWPGNVRELKNVVERALYRADVTEIDEIVFDPFPESTGPAREGMAKAQTIEPTLPCKLQKEIRELERSRLAQALRQAHHQQKQAAGLLGLSYHQFRGLYRKHKDALENRQEN